MCVWTHGYNGPTEGMGGGRTKAQRATQSHRRFTIEYVIYPPIFLRVGLTSLILGDVAVRDALDQSARKIAR